MPRLPQPTAQGRQGVLSLPQPSARQFGLEAFETLRGIGEQIQAQQDKIDLAELAGDYETSLEGVKAKVLQEPDASKHAEVFKRETQAAQQQLFGSRSVSRSVQQAFQAHAAGEHAKAFLDVSHEVQKRRADRAVADFSQTEQRLTEKAALDVDPVRSAQSLALLGELRGGMVSSGLMKASEAQKRQESAQDRYWSIYAQQRPHELLDLVNHPLEGGENIAGMDSEKRNVYVNLAINTLHAQQSQANHTQAELDKALKEKQSANLSSIKADLIEGKPLAPLGPLVRAREIDEDKVASVLELQTKLAQVPDMGQYQRGLATGVEADLNKAKYDNRPFDPIIFDQLDTAFVQGRILKDEYTHLSTLARANQEHKSDPTKGARNQEITHAVANLDTVMESANKLTGYSAIGNQATAAAKEYFYRRVAQEPQANPWDIMHEAETRFKPLVEKQQGLSKTDQLLLNDAKIDAQAKLKIISPAAAKAYKEQSQDERGRKAVAEALKALPPPPEPGFLERLFQKKAPARTIPGVMGQ